MSNNTHSVQTGFKKESTGEPQQANLDDSGNLKVVTSGGGGSAPSGTIGAAVPATASPIAVKDSSGNLAYPALDASGNLLVAVTGAGSGGTSSADRAAYVAGTTAGTPLMVARDDAAVGTLAEDKVGIARGSSLRELYTQIRDALGNDRGVKVNASNEASITIADASDVATGATIDNPWLGGPAAGSVIAVLKYIGTILANGTATVSQGLAGTIANSWFTQITDSLNGPVAVKAPSTAAVAADQALVVAISPNNTVPTTSSTLTTTGTIAGLTQTVNAAVTGYASAAFQLLATGGPTGFLAVEVSIDGGTTYFAAECWNPINGGTGPIISNNSIDVATTSSGLWVVPLPPGATNLKFRENSWISGSWALTIKASTFPAMDWVRMGQPIISAPTNGGGSGQQMLVTRGGAATYLIDSTSGSVVTVNGSSLADTFANPANLLEVQTFPYNYNGATWDRTRGDSANGLDVDVTRSVLPTGAATSSLQTQPGVDIGDVTVNNGAGASAVNIQDGGNAITVDGTVTVTQATGTNLHTVLDSGTLSTITNVVHVDDNAGSLTVDSPNLDVALSTRLKAADTLAAVTTVGTITNPVTVTQGTAANLKVDLSGTGANPTAIKVDGSAVIQPVSGTVSISGSVATTSGLASITTTTQVRPAWRQNVVLLASNASRKNGLILNGTDAPLYLNEGTSASDATYLAIVPPNGRYALEATNEVDGWWNIPPTSGWAVVTERT